ncbi:MAG: GNAT family N-acetyltransferase [Chloroflexota bacterium]
MPATIPVPERLAGPRVLLRVYDVADAPLVRAAVEQSREHLVPWLPWAAKAHRTPEDSIDFCVRSRARWLLRAGINYGIFTRDGTAYLGGIGLQGIDWSVRRFEIGYWLRAGAEGHGYMTEAVRLLTQMVFQELGATRVEIRCEGRNARSRKVAERSGFVHEATLRRYGQATDGSLKDLLVFGMIREDFDAALPGWRESLGRPDGSPDRQ